MYKKQNHTKLPDNAVLIKKPSVDVPRELIANSDWLKIHDPDDLLLSEGYNAVHPLG